MTPMRSLDAVIGGWQLSGLARWTSGFPVTIVNGATWPTNWQLGGDATQLAPISTHVTENAGRQRQSVLAAAGPDRCRPRSVPRTTCRARLATATRLRGPGFAGLDLGLSKRWKMPWGESHNLVFRWEVFNVPNLHRFDVQTVDTDITSPSFGNFSGLLTNPRVMQFALRYEF